VKNLWSSNLYREKEHQQEQEEYKMLVEAKEKEDMERPEAKDQSN
jgi:hypothetical protein